MMKRLPATDRCSCSRDSSISIRACKQMADWEVPAFSSDFEAIAIQAKVDIFRKITTRFDKLIIQVSYYTNFGRILPGMSVRGGGF